MSGRILWGSISLTVAVVCLAVPTNAQSPASPAAQIPVPTPAATSQTHQAPEALAGIWKFNKDLSSDTSTVQTQAQNAQSGGDTGARRRGFGGIGRSGKRPQPDNTQALQVRALLREMADQPARETIVVTPETTTLTDDQGVVRKFTTNGKKETIDLEATQVDSVSKWDGSVLTVELSAGSFTLTETYQVTVQGHELVVALSAAHSSRQGGVPTPGPVKRIYDKADAGG